MSPNPQEFAQKVLQTFAERGLTTDDLVGAAGGPSDTYMTGLRKAARGDSVLPRPRRDSGRRIEIAAGWPDGAAQAVWETGELPTPEEARSIGSGRVPAPDGPIHKMQSRVTVDGAGQPRYVVTTWAHANGAPSRLDLTYTPGPGTDVDMLSLGAVAGQAHREAMRLTYQQERGEEHADARSAATKTPDPGPADQPGQDDYGLAARDVKDRRALEAGEQETAQAGEPEPDDTDDMEPR